MAFKICVLLLTFFLFHNGQTSRLRLYSNSNNKLNEAVFNYIQNVFIKKYPQAAIDKYIIVIRQLYSEEPEERQKGNFEWAVLLIEGAIYQTAIERGYPVYYDVRSALERIEETSDSDEDLEEMDEKTLEALTTDLRKEFSSEVVQKIVSIFEKLLKAESLAETKSLAIELTILAMDGARVVTSEL